MLRHSLAILTLIVFASFTNAQPGPLPLSPGVRPPSPIGPGTQFIPQSPPRFMPPRRVINPQFPQILLPWYIPAPFGFGYGDGYVAPDYALPAPQPLVEEPRQPTPNVILANEFPATLTLQFPAPADVWLNGTAVKGAASEERVLKSPVLKQGEQYTFEVKARWTRGGKTYESTREVTVGAGNRSRLIVVTGTEVK